MSLQDKTIQQIVIDSLINTIMSDDITVIKLALTYHTLTDYALSHEQERYLYTSKAWVNVQNKAMHYLFPKAPHVK